ncbi:Ger(x)C family spore germination protein [Paenibacillus sp. NPDC056579]|uniref:Ger(x)C family spore germination protein n=1 Tax=Paenibacillus sp. NPDC056579 TaxID=3345871 RepID=UPI00368BFD3A
MRNVSLKLAAMMGCLLMLAGCWDVKTIQDINYTTAVGLDYEEGQYIVYVQLLDFANVAKQEGGGKPTQQSPVFVGRGEGITLGAAFNEVTKAAQQQMFWGHVSAVVIGEGLLKRGLKKEDFDSMIRFREIRFSQWIYGTRQPITNIFNKNSFFNLSPLSTILHHPEMNYAQNSTIRPLRFQTFVSLLQEPGKMVLLPSIGITSESWIEDRKPQPMLYNDGVFAINKEGSAAFFEADSMMGVRWTETKTMRITLTVSGDGRPIGSLVCKNPDSVFKTKMEGETPTFTVSGSVDCRINELIKEGEPDLIKQMAEKEIRRQVESSYKSGKEKGRDVLGLEHVLYRQDFESWSKLTDNGKRPLPNYTLKSVQFKVDLIHSGMYREERTEDNY